MSDDLGVKIGQLAKALSYEALREMLAIHQMDLWTPPKIKCPIINTHLGFSPMRDLVHQELIRWIPIGKFRGIPQLSELGQRVMLARVEYELDRAQDNRAPCN